MTDLNPCRQCGSQPRFSNGKINGKYVFGCECGNAVHLVGALSEQGGAAGVETDLIQKWNYHNPLGAFAGSDSQVIFEGSGPHWLPAMQSVRVEPAGDHLLLQITVARDGKPFPIYIQVGRDSSESLLRQLPGAVAAISPGK